MLGFRGRVLLLLKIFLHGRHQCVSSGQFRSSMSELNAGVPQGSILSQSLFNLYASDLANAIPASVYQYANDTVLLARASSYADVVCTLQTDIDICPLSECEPVNLTSTVKYVGLFFDSDLSWNTHFARICQKLCTVSCVTQKKISYATIGPNDNCTCFGLKHSPVRHITVNIHCSIRFQNRVDFLLHSLLKMIAYNIDIYVMKNNYVVYCFCLI